MSELGNDSENNLFSKSDIGAQSAWKGFSSQTLYIASRIATDTENYGFYPEDIEDLVIKKDGIVVEAIQVKNISSDLTLSHLASTKSSNPTKSSKNGEGFFKRVCSLHASFPSLSKIRIVYFNELGKEINGFLKGDEGHRKSILKKLTDNHGISVDYAEWLLSSLIFEKVSIEQLQIAIADQLKDCVPIMAAPDLAQSLLVQYVSDLSRTKGSTSLQQWQEQIFQIGTDIAAIDGYYKEYQKSLLRLCDLTLEKSLEQLENEFKQGVSAHPSHIRNNLDFYRTDWLNKIDKMMEKDKAVIIKGVSGQGKSALCFRYLFDHYPEQFVFYVSRVGSSRQAENLAIALRGISKHTNNMIVYIDVNPGEQQWILLIQELQARGVSIPVLVSVREEDFKMTRVDGSSVNYELVELSLSEKEGKSIYEAFTATMPHPQFRSFEEAWARFGTGGPLLEFVYLLTNNQTLSQRLQAQIDNLLIEGHPDSWFMLLQLVCFAGKTGCPLIFDDVRKEVTCDNVFPALQRLSNEYLIRRSENGVYIESLHPLRAQIICKILSEKMGEDSSRLILAALKCIESNYSQLLLMDYFSNNIYSSEIIGEIAAVEQRDWIFCAGLIRTMLWLDVKRYVEQNREAIDILIQKHGSGWFLFMPLDISGLAWPDKFILESLATSMQNVKAEDIEAEIERIKSSLTSLKIDYEATDMLISNCTPPSSIPTNDNEWSLFGYSLFWFAKRSRIIDLPFTLNQLSEMMLSGDIRSKADAIRGICEQDYIEFSNSAIETLSSRMVKDYCIINLNVTDFEVQCYCVPPVFDNDKIANTPKNFNHYWKMKVMNILNQMYSEREYIEVALIGVNLLRDLGIEAIDDKARIHKTNRHNAWISEINSWEISRTDYFYRPDSWEHYVNQVDEIRKCSSNLVSDAIKYFEFVYKNQRHDEELFEKLIVGVEKIKQLLFSDLLLPKTVVDPYCLFRENMMDADPNLKQHIDFEKSLSLNIYTEFRKSFDNTYRQLKLFFDQFADILLARLARQTLDNIENPKSPLINLFGSAKSLLMMQMEYNTLFSHYRTLTDGFEKQEIEEMLTLVTVWSHIFEYPMKGYTRIYNNNKHLYKKSSTIIEQAFKTALNLIGGEAHTIDDKTYLMIDLNTLSDDALKNAYKNVVLILRDAYKKAQPFNSIRWYLETQVSELIYVPVYNKIPLFVGFQISTDKILNVNEDQISTKMFPAELPVSIYADLGMNYEELNKWKISIGYFSMLKMLITQYNDVLDTLSSSTSICEDGVTQYISLILNQLSDIINKLNDCIKLPLESLKLVFNQDIAETFRIIQNVSDEMQIVPEKIAILQKVEGFEQKIDNAVTYMILIQSYVLEGAKICNNRQE